MAPYRWAIDPKPVQDRVSARGGNCLEASALIGHAVWAVNALHYLSDIDSGALHLLERNGFEHNSDIVDIAHVRWATGTAITSIDLCAAAIARIFCDHSGSHEADMRSFAPAKKKLRELLPKDALAWVDTVIEDADYLPILDTRNPMTHARKIRHLSTADRTSFDFGLSPVSAPVIVTRCRDFATRNVEAFLSSIEFLAESL